MTSMTTTKEDPGGRQLLASRPITRASRVSFPPPQLRNPEKYESTSLAARALSFRPGPFGSRPTTYPSHRGTRWLISRVQKSARSVGRSSSSFSLSTSYLIVFPRLRASVTLAPPANPEAERLFSRPPARIRSRRLKKKKRKTKKFSMEEIAWKLWFFSLFRYRDNRVSSSPNRIDTIF